MVGALLQVPSASIKNLRDEFDPIHPNTRKGWHKRPLRPNRQRVIGEFCDTSDAALLEIVERIFAFDSEVEREITRPLSRSRRGEDVAERLRTGRKAEEFVLRESHRILGVGSEQLIDRREEAIGYDFGRLDQPRAAIEVKGLTGLRGTITFTDHEWATAGGRRLDYLVVVIGNVYVSSPSWLLVRDPTRSLGARAHFRRQTSVSWSAPIRVEISDDS